MLQLKSLRDIPVKTSLGWFFLFISSVGWADTNDIAHETFWDDWSRLLYVYNEPLINTPDFLLSFDDFSLKNEFIAIKEALASDPSVACRFPARVRMLDRLGYLDFRPSFSHCAELQEYLNKVPVDSFHYVFASENLHSVTSMMGHGFLVAKGIDSKNVLRRHTFSFFAEFESQNPLILFFRAMVSGMPGRFMVRPYAPDLTRYIQTEKREVWDYELALNDKEIEHLKLALWELRDVEPTYFFHSFNCATLALYALSIVDKEVPKHDILFTSPLDIAKAMYDEDRIKAITLSLPEVSLQNLSLNSQNPNQALTADEILRTKDPLKLVQDSALSLAIGSRGVSLSALPASHYLRTPSVDRNSSTEMKIGTFSLTSDGEIDEVSLYSFKNYAPVTRAVSPPSSEFYVGYRDLGLGRDKRDLDIMGTFGKTRNIGGFQVTALLGGGISSSEQYMALSNSVSYEFGGRNKFIASSLIRNFSNSRLTSILTFEFSHRLSAEYVGYVKFEEVGSEEGTYNFFELGVDFHF